MSLSVGDLIGYKQDRRPVTGAELLLELAEVVGRWERGGAWFQEHGPYDAGNPRHIRASLLMCALLDQAHDLYNAIEAQAPGDPEAEALLGRLCAVY